MAKQTITFLKVWENQGQHGSYKTLSIKTDAHKDEYITAKYRDDWKVGDVVDFEVEEYAKKNGARGLKVVDGKSGSSYKTEFMALHTKLDQISQQIRVLHDHLSGKSPLNVTSAGTKVPFSEDDGNPF